MIYTAWLKFTILIVEVVRFFLDELRSSLDPNEMIIALIGNE